jgi:hypothetical protein
MKKELGLSLLAALATVALAATTSVQAQVASMTFFVTSVGSGADHQRRQWPSDVPSARMISPWRCRSISP